MHGLFVCVGYCFPFSLKQFKDNLDVCAKIDAIRLCMWTGVSQWRLYNTHSETFVLAGKPGTYNLSKMSERNLLINWYPFYDMPNYSRKLSRHPNTWAAFIYGTLPLECFCSRKLLHSFKYHYSIFILWLFLFFFCASLIRLSKQLILTNVCELNRSKKDEVKYFSLLQS